MELIETCIPGVVIVQPRIFGDERGYFFESFSQRDFERQVCKTVFVQDNESKSCYGVVRGLHFQQPPYAQSKLVRVVKGRVLDVAVDIRKGSPTFGKHVSVELTEENKRQFFVPRGRTALKRQGNTLRVKLKVQRKMSQAPTCERLRRLSAARGKASAGGGSLCIRSPQTSFHISLEKVFFPLFLSKKEPKKTARRK